MNLGEQECVAVIDDAIGGTGDLRRGAAVRNEVLAVLWSLQTDVIRI
jgi:hypothetical protein